MFISGELKPLSPRMDTGRISWIGPSVEGNVTLARINESVPQLLDAPSVPVHMSFIEDFCHHVYIRYRTEKCMAIHSSFPKIHGSFNPRDLALCATVGWPRGPYS